MTITGLKSYLGTFIHFLRRIRTTIGAEANGRKVHAIVQLPIKGVKGLN